MGEIGGPDTIGITCRVCLTTDCDRKYISLLEEPLKSRFTECTTIEISDTDHLSTDLCSLCVARCESAKHFREQALASNAMLIQTKRKGPDPPGDLPSEHEIVIEETLQEEDTEKQYMMDEEIIYEDEEEEIETEIIENEIEDLLPSPNPEVNLKEKDTPVIPSSTGSCQFCGVKFPTRIATMLHLLADHPNKTYTCEVCQKSFASPQTWRSHNCISNSGTFPCRTCHRIFKHRSVLGKHEKMHSKDRFECEVCQKQFVLLSQYRTHLKRHTDKSFTCEHCQKAFKEKRELVRHLHIVHSENRPFFCDQCPKAFACRYMLKRHLRVHTGERPYPCSICQLNLSSQNALKHHMYTHTGDKPYKCEVCAASFRVKVNLSKHLKEHHSTGEEFAG